MNIFLQIAYIITLNFSVINIIDHSILLYRYKHVRAPSRPFELYDRPTKGSWGSYTSPLKSFLPLKHAGLDLDLLVAGEDDPDVDVAGVSLLLAQEVVDPGLNVVAQAGGLQPLGGEPVLFSFGPGCLVTTVTFESEQ